MDTYGLRAASEAAASVANVLAERVRHISLSSCSFQPTRIYPLHMCSYWPILQGKLMSYLLLPVSAMALAHEATRSTYRTSCALEAHRTSELALRLVGESLLDLPPSLQC